MKQRSLFTTICLSALLVAIYALAPTNAASQEEQETPVFSGKSLSDFSLIFERNIFNPNRQKKEPERPVIETPKQDEISLVGTLVSETQRYAFFDGSSPEYSRVLAVGAEIGGGAIQTIDVSSIQLRLGEEDVTVPVGKRLVREKDQPWRLQDAPRRIESRSNNDGPREQPTPANDLLRKLMERRNQEQSK
ncbi:hypothetical protein K8I31_11330 [bacterium]|nr:hypothetical protein [bacterium]